MRFEMDDSPERRYYYYYYYLASFFVLLLVFLEDNASVSCRCAGVVTGVCDMDPYRWPNSKWRCLLVRVLPQLFDVSVFQHVYKLFLIIQDHTYVW